MASPIKIKRSAVPGKVPATTDLQLGELGMNTNDGKLYMKKDDGSESVVELSSGGGSGTFVEVGGDNMTGDLTLGTDKIVLDAGDGSAEFSGSTFIGGVLPSAPATTLFNDGSAEFLGPLTVGDGDPTSGANNGAMLMETGALRLSRVTGTDALKIYTTGSSAAKSAITSDGKGEFTSVQVDSLLIDDTSIISSGTVALVAGGTSSIIFKTKNTNGNYSFRNSGDTASGLVRFDGITQNRSYDFPDASGTVALTSYVKPLAKFGCRNTPVTTTNTFAVIDVVGNAQFSEGLWTRTSSTIEIPEDGYYSCSFAITTTSTAQRATDTMAFSVNGTTQAGESSNGYIRNSNSINEAACTLHTILQLSAGDLVSIVSAREGDVTTSGATVAGKSSISIHKL